MSSMFNFYSSKTPSENDEKYYSPFTSKERQLANNIEEKNKRAITKKK